MHDAASTPTHIQRVPAATLGALPASGFEAALEAQLVPASAASQRVLETPQGCVYKSVKHEAPRGYRGLCWLSQHSVAACWRTGRAWTIRRGGDHGSRIA